MLYSLIKKRSFGFLIAVATVLSAKAFAVTGGEQLVKSDVVHSSIVNIKMKNGMCTGTIIAPRVVLTAAHCVDVFGKAEIVAFIDGTKTNDCNISKVVDSEFAPGAIQDLPFKVHSPDILLLKLETALCSTKTINAHSDPILKIGDVLKGAGHGRGNKKFGAAEYFELEIIETKNLENLVSPMTPIYSDILKIGARTYKFALPVKSGSSFCTGDSGGPVYVEQNGVAYQFGVNGAVLPNQTLGSERCDQAYLQVITPLAPYISWMEQKISDWK